MKIGTKVIIKSTGEIYTTNTHLFNEMRFKDKTYNNNYDETKTIVYVVFAKIKYGGSTVYGIIDDKNNEIAIGAKGVERFNVNKYQLLLKAMSDYPKGTKFKSLSGVEFISTGIFNFDHNSILRVAETGKLHGNVFTNQWAEIITTKQPLLVSEDGVPLFEGDYYVCVKNLHGNGWEVCFEQALGASHFVITDAEICKAFSTKDSALAWIVAQQPKEIEVVLECGGVTNLTAKITTNKVRFFKRGSFCLVDSLSAPDIEAISNALKTLKK